MSNNNYGGMTYAYLTDGIQVTLPNDERLLFIKSHERWEEIMEACNNNDGDLLVELHKWEPEPIMIEERQPPAIPEEPKPWWEKGVNWVRGLLSYSSGE